MEKDDEVKSGTGNHYDFGARCYDSRLGRWLSIDPLHSSFVDLAPYVIAANSPIVFIDPDGETIKVVVVYEAKENEEPKFETIEWKPGAKAPAGANASTLKVYEGLKALNEEGGAGGKAMINYLATQTKMEVTIEAVPGGSSTYEDASQHVVWNPTEGLVVKSGGKSPPLLGLAHELGHTEQHFKLTEALAAAKAAKDPKAIKEAKEALKLFNDEAKERMETRSADEKPSRLYIGRIPSPTGGEDLLVPVKVLVPTSFGTAVAHLSHFAVSAPDSAQMAKN